MSMSHAALSRPLTPPPQRQNGIISPLEVSPRNAGNGC